MPTLRSPPGAVRTAPGDGRETDAETETDAGIGTGTGTGIDPGTAAGCPVRQFRPSVRLLPTSHVRSHDTCTHQPLGLNVANAVSLSSVHCGLFQSAAGQLTMIA